jgi:hypothetical protein
LENTKGDRLPATQSGPDSDEDDDLAGHALKVAMPDMEEDFHPAPHIRDTDNAQRGFISRRSTSTRKHLIDLIVIPEFSPFE